MFTTETPALPAGKKKKKAPRPLQITVRGLRQGKSGGRDFSNSDPLKALTAALDWRDCAEAEPVIEWQGRDRLCVLDVDYHDTPPPDEYTARRIMYTVQPRPEHWWISHGGGLKLVYTARGRLTAEDQAAIARMVLHQAYIRESGMELASRTRHPAYARGEQKCGTVHWAPGDGLDEARRILLGDTGPGSSIDQDKVDEWLEEHGFEQGRRYEHKRCLIDPNETAAGDPVIVLDHGIYCHRCAGKGICYEGAGNPGFVSWWRLVEGSPVRIANHLRAAVKGMCHWEHARHFIEGQDREGYRALLRLWHLGEKNRHPATTRRLIDKVFFPEIPRVRTGGAWLQSDSFTPASREGLELIIREMPAVRYVKGKGKEGIRPIRLALFRGDDDLSKYGYPPVIPLRGVDIANRVRDPFTDTRVYATVQADPPFKYRPSRDMEAVERTIRGCYPSVNLNLLRLLIACKGLVQRGDPLDVPQVFITGQSGSGKSMHARLAAQIACDRVEEIRFDPQRFMQGYADASDSCSFALYNEASKCGITGVQLRDFCLSFVRGMKYHRLYEGQRRIECPAVVIMTDCSVPNELRADEQTARRIALVDLGAGVNASDGIDWQRTCGTGTVERWRAGWGHTDVADAFLSDVMDRYFKGSGWTFRKIVEDLGFEMMNQQAEDCRNDLRELYRLVMELPEHDGSSRWDGQDWRVFRLDEVSPVADLFRDLTNGGSDTQAVEAAKWGEITGQPGLVCKFRRHGRRVGLRFRQTAAVAVAS
jgi:hypothetical protein